MTTDISNRDDIIDSSDVIARIDELESELEALNEAVEEAATALADADAEVDDMETLNGEYEDAQQALKDWNDEEGIELENLRALAEEAEGYSDDWRHGATLVRDSYFSEYAQELVQDIGDMPNGIPSYIVIDWEATADNIKADYTSVDFDGVEYWVR